MARPDGNRASDFNRAVEEAFACGADTVLLCPPGVVASLDALTIMSTAAAHIPEGAVLTAVVVDARSAPHACDVRPYRSGYYWSAPELRWRSEQGHALFGGDRAAEIEQDDGHAADVLLIPRTAWQRVGPFDKRFGAQLADLDWAARAVRAGLPCLRVVGKEFLGTLPDVWAGHAMQADEVYSLYLYARKHWPAHRWIALFPRRLGRSLRAEIARVRFWADFGVHIDVLRRTLWYVGNLLKRPRVQQEWVALRRTLRPQ